MSHCVQESSQFGLPLMRNFFTYIYTVYIQGAIINLVYSSLNVYSPIPAFDVKILLYEKHVRFYFLNKNPFWKVLWQLEHKGISFAMTRYRSKQLNHYKCYAL